MSHTSHTSSQNLKHLNQIERCARRIYDAMDQNLTDNEFDAILNDTVPKIIDRVGRIRRYIGEVTEGSSTR
jgi:hypothetical protein